VASGSPGEVRGVRVIWEPINVHQASDGRDRWRVATMWEAILVDCAQGDATVHRLPPRSRIRPSDPPDFQRRRVRQINLYPTAAAAAASYAALIPRFMILLAWFLYSRRWIQHGHGWIRVPSLHRGCRRLLRRPCTRRRLAGGHCVLCIPVVRHIGFRRPSATAGKVSRNMSCHRGC